MHRRAIVDRQITCARCYGTSDSRAIKNASFSSKGPVLDESEVQEGCRWLREANRADPRCDDAITSLGDACRTAVSVQVHLLVA